MLTDLNELKTFREVLTRGSLSAAARALGVSAAVVSKRLMTLETRVGARLIHRTTRSLSATEQGARLLVQVERALDALRHGEEVLESGNGEISGALCVSSPVTFGRVHVAPVLGELAKRYTKLTIGLRLEDRYFDLAAEGVDVAIRLGLPSDPRAKVRRLADSQRILVAAPLYLEARGRPSTPEELSGHEILRYNGASGPWRLIHQDGRCADVQVEARLRGDNGDAVHDWCLAGQGIFMECAVDLTSDLKAGRLERVLPEWSNGDEPIVATFLANESVPKKIDIFVAAMVEALLPYDQSRADSVN